LDFGNIGIDFFLYRAMVKIIYLKRLVVYKGFCKIENFS
jgi:hypothetical protein